MHLPGSCKWLYSTCNSITNVVLIVHFLSTSCTALWSLLKGTVPCYKRCAAQPRLVFYSKEGAKNCNHSISCITMADVCWKTRMSGKVFLPFLLLGAMYLVAETQPGAGGQCMQHNALNGTIKHPVLYCHLLGNLCAGTCYLGRDCVLGSFHADSYD